MARATFTIQSNLAAPVETVWEHARTLDGVSEELIPLVRMTGPRNYAFDSSTFTSGASLFQSWLLLFGFLPIDRHNVAMESIDPPHGFHECSSSLLQREWIHVRRLEPRDEGCTITDTVTYAPRLAFLTSTMLAIYRLVFHHRHQQLRRKFGRIAA